MTTSVFITTRFEGFHCWPEAPEQVSFLRDMHRHVFHVRLEVEVGHQDRDVEYILLKRDVDSYIEKIRKTPVTDTWSCETWASVLLEQFQAMSVEVSEDGENGAVCRR